MMKRLLFAVIMVIAFVLCMSILGCDDARKLPYSDERIVRSDSFKLAYTALPPDSVIVKDNHVFYIPEVTEAQNQKIFFLIFDPHGMPEKAIKMYSMLANKYGIVLAGTKGSKNGLAMNIVVDAGKKLIKEIKERYDEDSLIFYYGGFSGGAQAAFALAEVQTPQGLVYSGTPGNLPSKPTAIMGLAGTRDMNYADLLRFAENVPLAYQSILLRYSGGHEWPQAYIMEAALQWIACRSRYYDNCTNESIEKIGKASAKNLPEIVQKVQAAELIYFVKHTSGLNASVEQKALQQLKNAGDYKAISAKESAEIAMELNLKDVYTNAIFEKDKQWWTAEISRLRSSADINPTNQRLIGFFSLIAYSLSLRALEGGDTATTAKILHIYRTADPKNTEQSYLNARFQAKIGNKWKAIYYLEEAINNGMQDKSKLMHEDFATILADEELERLKRMMITK
jgi:hypothetical protein